MIHHFVQFAFRQRFLVSQTRFGPGLDGRFTIAQKAGGEIFQRANDNARAAAAQIQTNG